jgi:tetratricopeptide (TPR) repeat protein
MRRRAIAIVVALALVAAGGSLCVHAWKVWHRPVGSSASLTAEGIQIEDQGNDLDAAGERYEAALAADDGNKQARARLGLLRFKQARWEEAVPLMQRAADEDPTNSEILINIGTALLTLDRNEEAVVWLKRATTVAPDSAAAHNNLGVALAKMTLWEESAAEFQRTLEIKPDHRTAGRSLLMVRQQIPAKTR